MDEIDRSVLGHLCEGLKRFQSRVGWMGEPSDSACIPIFNAQGQTMGCDDTNYTVIVYCPFCGEKL